MGMMVRVVCPDGDDGAQRLKRPIWIESTVHGYRGKYLNKFNHISMQKCSVT